MAKETAPSIRVSDAERQRVVSALSKNAADGRLTLEELEERVGAAYAAKTYADLEPLLRDLPEGQAAQVAPSWGGPSWAGRGPNVPGWRAPGWHYRDMRWQRGPWRRPRFSFYFRTVVLCWAIWAVSVATSGGHGLEGFWPIWLMVPWGLCLLNGAPLYMRRRW